MDMEQALLKRLLEDAALAALVGESVAWEDRPQDDTFPGISLQVISNPRDQHMQGFQQLERTRVQADVWALSYGDKKAVTEALVAAAVPAGEFHGITFDRADIAADADRPSGAPEGDGKPFIYRRQIDFIIWHSQA
jgi:Protein of unknown function (DUF3168)